MYKSEGMAFFRIVDVSVPTAPRVTLTLSPGNHQLSTDLTLQGKTSWELKDAGIGLSNISCTKGSSCSPLVHEILLNPIPGAVGTERSAKQF